MNAGKLNTRVQIQQRSTTQDALGQVSDTWTTTMTVWGDVRYQSGLRSLSADELHSQQRCSIRIRQTSCSRGIAPGMRALVGLQTFDIVGTLPQGRETIDLVCQLR